MSLRHAFYWFICWLVRVLWKPMGGIHATGLQNVPREGPFIVIANHQSYLDPLFLQAVCPRLLHAMAKSTQFASPIFRHMMTLVYSFPVRRFEIDPQAVRHVLRALETGDGVVIYIEGERTWDGELQSPRLGTIRLILKAGVPVIPCRIDGTYDVWPRWHNRVQKHLVHVDFRPPLRFPKLNRKADRELNVQDTAETIMTSLKVAARRGG